MQNYLDDDLLTCQYCNKYDLRTKLINGEFICPDCDRSRCFCCHDVTPTFVQGLYCDDCGDDICYGQYDDMI